jgi:putative methionine-R-sulfoxide reductase with GAF domain
MKSYISSRNLLSRIERVLSENRPSFHRSPLEAVAALLCEGRHYSWVGIYLTLGEHASPALLETAVDPTHVAMPGTRMKVLVAIKIAARELGFLNVESDRDHAFGSGDRVLLERVAGLLGRFLAGPGKYLVLKIARAGTKPKAAAA